MKKLAVLFAAILVLLTGCKGNPLPDGMDEATLLSSGQAVVDQLNANDFEGVLASFRADIQSAITAETIEGAYDSATEKAGAFVSVSKTLATGYAEENGVEAHGVAVIVAKHQKDDVCYRIAFDPTMTLIGMDITEN